MTLTSAITVSPVFTGKMRIRRKTTVPWRARWVCKLHVTLDRSRCAIFRGKIPAIPVIYGRCVSLVSRKVSVSKMSPVFTGKLRSRSHIPVIPVPVTLVNSRCAIFRGKIPAIPVINGSCVSLVSRKVRISTVSPVFTGKVRFRGHIPVIPVFPVDRACSLA